MTHRNAQPLTEVGREPPPKRLRDQPEYPDPARLRKLKDGLQRNTTAVVRIIDQILAELEVDEDRAA